MSDEEIEVYERTDPLIRYTITEEVDGVEQAHNLGQYASLEWYVRDTTVGEDLVPNRTSTADPGGITITVAAQGKCQVQARAADIGTPGRKKCYLLGVTADGLRTPLSFRQLKVKDL